MNKTTASWTMRLQHKIIFCSPLTLYAILAVIRQSIDNFALERKSGEMIKLLKKFKEQWDRFVDAWTKWAKKFRKPRANSIR
jgi:DNA recombination protein RmuC